MTKQETFDTVVTRIVAQGRPATSSSTCAYRNPEGLKCAAGVLIPDDRYTPDMEEGEMWTGGRVAKLLCEELGHDFKLLRDLQRAHDGNADKTDDFVDRFKHDARDVALAHGLSAAVLD